MRASDASAITGGQADTAVLSGPNIYALADKGNARLLAWYSDELKQSPGNATSASGKDANERPDALKHFLAAFRKGAATWDAAFIDASGYRADQPSAPAGERKRRAGISRMGAGSAWGRRPRRHLPLKKCP